MVNPYENCPVFENDSFVLRLVEASDAPDLLLVYSDKRSVPLFNSDNCNGDDFYYTSPARMEKAITFWLEAYRYGAFVRWAIVDKNTRLAIGTIELFNRRSEDYFDNCGLLRLDLRSDYEDKVAITEILSLIIPEAFALFGCRMLATKIPPFACDRKAALEAFGFCLSGEVLTGEHGKKIYTDYYTLQKPAPESTVLPQQR